MENKRRFYATWLVLLILCGFAISVGAQVAGNGEIEGTIADPSGAVITGAKVAATNVATGVKTNTVTTKAGLYALSPLPPGDYSVSVEANGFKPLKQENVTVNALSVVGLNLSLQVGEGTEEVTVTAAPPQLDTSNATLGTTIDNAQYTALPLAMEGGPKAPDAFVQLLPGVGNPGLSGGGININGSAMRTDGIYIDGLPSTSGNLTGQNIPLDFGFPIETIDQFQVETNGTPAMYDGFGSMNFVIKSGTNQMHGKLYEYIRNTAFDSRGYFSPTVPIEKQNEFGGVIGGPIVKDRLFYFGSYDGYRLRQGSSPAFYNLPTVAERNGDFSALPVTIYDPATTQCTSSGTCTRQAFQNNIIPQSRFSTVSKYLQSFLANPTNGSLQNNYLGSLTPGIDQNRFLVKVNDVVSSNDRIDVFFDVGTYSNPGLPPLGAQLPLPYTSARFNNIDTDNIGFGYTHTFSPTLLNQLNAEYTRYVSSTRNPTNGGGWAGKAGLGGLPAGPASDNFPPVTFGGPNSPTSWDLVGDTENISNTGNTYGIGDNLQWVHGRNNLNIGFQLSFQEQNVGEPVGGSVANTFTFSNVTTSGFTAKGALDTTQGNAYASFLLGQLSNASLTQSSIAEIGGRWRQYGFYIQDDLKVTPRLTLNLGIREDINTPFVEVHNTGSWLNPTSPNPAIGGYQGALQFAGYGPYSCQCRTPIATHYKNVAPRVGFAYSINPKTVVSSFYGIFFIPGGAGNGENSGTGFLGYQAQPSLASLNEGISSAFDWDNGFPAYTPPPSFSPTLNTGYNTTTPGGGAVTTYGDPRIAGRSPYMQAWSLRIQRTLTPSTVLSVIYSASTSHSLTTGGACCGIYSNQIQPQYLALGALLTASATPANVAKAQAIIPGIQLPYANFSGTIVQMLRPFPQYSSVSDVYPLYGAGNYNSLQVLAQKQLSRGLTFLLGYTFAKEIDDAGSNNQLASVGTFRTAYNLAIERSVGRQNIPNELTASYVYYLPFGSGHRLGSSNTLVRAFVSNWRFSGIQQYIQGVPLGPFTATCNAPDTGTCYANYNPAFSGKVRINGKYGSGNVLGGAAIPFINVSAFENPAPYTLGNTPRTQPFGLRNPPTYSEAFSLLREFKLPKEMSFQFQASAFNAFNRVVFGGISTSISSASFGAVSTQNNTPRQFQFEGQIVF